MIFRKRQKRFRNGIRLIVLALLINLFIPLHIVTAQDTNPDGSPVNLATNRGPEAVSPVPIIEPTLIPAIGPTPRLPRIKEKPIVVVRTMVVRASAYSSTPDQTDSSPFTTAMGSRVRDGIIAVNGLPFGTKVLIRSHYGTKVFKVEDRMAKRWGTKKIDIWMPSRNAAKQWGVRTVTMQIIK